MPKTLNKYELFPSLKIYEKLEVPYLLLNRENWMGPLWTGINMMIHIDEGYGDESHFHELCHWLVASKAQRELPDYGLGGWVNGKPLDFSTSKMDYIYWESGSDPNKGGRNLDWGGGKPFSKIGGKQESLACHALALYDQLVLGKPWENFDWDVEDFSEQHNLGTYQEFGGDLSDCDNADLKNIYNKIVKPIRPRTTWRQFSSHVDLIVKNFDNN